MYLDHRDTPSDRTCWYPFKKPAVGRQQTMPAQTATHKHSLKHEATGSDHGNTCLRIMHALLARAHCTGRKHCSEVRNTPLPRPGFNVVQDNCRIHVSPSRAFCAVTLAASALASGGAFAMISVSIVHKTLVAPSLRLFPPASINRPFSTASCLAASLWRMRSVA